MAVQPSACIGSQAESKLEEATGCWAGWRFFVLSHSKCEQANVTRHTAGETAEGSSRAEGDDGGGGGEVQEVPGGGHQGGEHWADGQGAAGGDKGQMQPPSLVQEPDAEKEGGQYLGTPENITVRGAPKYLIKKNVACKYGSENIQCAGGSAGPRGEGGVCGCQQGGGPQLHHARPGSLLLHNVFQPCANVESGGKRSAEHIGGTKDVGSPSRESARPLASVFLAGGVVEIVEKGKGGEGSYIWISKFLVQKQARLL